MGFSILIIKCFSVLLVYIFSSVSFAVWRLPVKQEYIFEVESVSGLQECLLYRCGGECLYLNGSLFLFPQGAVQALSLHLLFEDKPKKYLRSKSLPSGSKSSSDLSASASNSSSGELLFPCSVSGGEKDLLSKAESDNLDFRRKVLMPRVSSVTYGCRDVSRPYKQNRIIIWRIDEDDQIDRPLESEEHYPGKFDCSNKKQKESDQKLFEGRLSLGFLTEMVKLVEKAKNSGSLNLLNSKENKAGDKGEFETKFAHENTLKLRL